MMAHCILCGDHIIFTQPTLTSMVGTTSTVAARHLKGALINLSVAAWGGDHTMSSLLRIKDYLEELEEWGPFFHCAYCGCDASVEEVFQQLT